MPSVCAMLPDGSVALTYKVTSRLVTATEDTIALNVSDLTQVNVACLLGMLSALELTTSDPVTPGDIASKNEALRVRVIVSCVELPDEFLGLLQYFVIICWPDCPVHLGGEGGRIVGGVRVAEGHPVVVDPRID